jgi:hypothetical protein
MVHSGILEAFTRSFHDVFTFGIPFAALAFVVALFLKEVPLRGAVPTKASNPEPLN